MPYNPRQHAALVYTAIIQAVFECWISSPKINGDRSFNKSRRKKYCLDRLDDLGKWNASSTHCKSYGGDDAAHAVTA